MYEQQKCVKRMPGTGILHTDWMCEENLYDAKEINFAIRKGIYNYEQRSYEYYGSGSRVYRGSD